MSKVNITGRSTRQPDLHNIPLRTDLGSKIRAALRDQQPQRGQVLQSINYSGLEMKLHAEYAQSMATMDSDLLKNQKLTSEEKTARLTQLYGGKRRG